MNFAPIAIFCYERLNHLEKLIQALQKSSILEESEIFFFIDGPKEGNVSSVEKVRDYVEKLNVGLSKHVFKRDKNIGLSKSIISGVNQVLDLHDRVIVLEDDLIPNEFFLRYCNEALNKYEKYAEVGCIHGYSYPIDNDSEDCYFLRGGDCWGWATWKSKWKLFNPDSRALLNYLKSRKLTWKFDLEGAYPFTKTLENSLLGKNDSWAIRWHASLFLAKHYCLYPPISLIENIGLDSSGTHCKSSDRYKNIGKINRYRFPSEVKQDVIMFQKIRKFHKPGRKTCKPRYLFEMLTNSLGKLLEKL
tara:strand:+ start:254 stop:1165 length:912 start_codon:yes stop_codon:yes gene_type:complete